MNDNNYYETSAQDPDPDPLDPDPGGKLSTKNCKKKHFVLSKPKSELVRKKRD